MAILRERFRKQKGFFNYIQLKKKSETPIEIKKFETKKINSPNSSLSERFKFDCLKHINYHLMKTLKSGRRLRFKKEIDKKVAKFLSNHYKVSYSRYTVQEQIFKDLNIYESFAYKNHRDVNKLDIHSFKVKLQKERNQLIFTDSKLSKNNTIIVKSPIYLIYEINSIQDVLVD